MLDLTKFPHIKTDNEVIDAHETNLREREAELSDKEKKVYALEKELEGQKEFIALSLKSLKDREDKIEEEKELLAQIKLEEIEFDKRKAEAVLAETQAQVKITELKELQGAIIK